MPPLRIAQIVGNLETGGTQALVMELMRRLDRERFDPALVYFKDPNHFAEEVTERGWSCHKVKVSRGYGGEELQALAQHLRRERIDLAHCHSDHANFGGRTAAIMAGVPRIVVHYHNTYEHRINGPFRRLERLLAPSTDLYIGCSQGVCDFVQGNLDVAGRPVRLLCNGVNLELYRQAGERRSEARARLGVPPGVFHIVHTARLEPHKQPGLLLEAVALAQRRPETQLGDWRLTFVGGGSLREELEKRVAALDAEAVQRGEPRISSRVHFAGWSREVPEWLASADVFALVSRNEGFSLSLVEAMAAGTPTIAGAIVGPLEVVGEEENGLLVDINSVESVMMALVRYLREDGLHRRIQTNGRARAEKFSIQSFISAAETLYEEAAAMSPTARPSGLGKWLLPRKVAWWGRRIRKG